MNGIEAVIATQVLDATAVGVALMTAVDAAAARSTIAAVPTARTLTINGTALDLSADRSWTVSGGVGGSTGAVDNAVLRADGTGGSTVQNSGLIISDTLEMRIGDATNAGKLRLQDSGQYSTTVLFNVFLGGIYLGQDISTFFVRGNGEVYSYQGYTCSNSGSGFTGHQFIFDGGWGSIQRAVGTPTGNGNRISNVYGLYVTCGAGHGFSVAAGTSTTFIDVFNTFTNSANYEKAILRFATYSSARYVQLACESLGTGIANMNLVLSPKGTGALIAGPMPDGTATGGNARGANAIDLQTIRTAATQVASGTATGLFAGRRNTVGSAALSSAIFASDDCTINQGTATATIACVSVSGNPSGQSALIGCFGATLGTVNQGVAIASQYATSNRSNQLVMGSGIWSAVGDRQTFWLNGGVKTTTNAAVECDFGLGVGNVPVRIDLAAGRQISGMLIVQGIKSDGSVSARYCRLITIRRVSNTTTLDDSSTVGTDLVNGTSLSVTADSVNHRLNVSPIGVAGETWRWQVEFRGLEQAYGT